MKITASLAAILIGLSACTNISQKVNSSTSTMTTYEHERELKALVPLAAPRHHRYALGGSLISMCSSRSCSGRTVFGAFIIKSSAF